MDTSAFYELCRIIYEKSGITLKEGKEALVNARVSKRLRALNLNSFEEYLDYLSLDKTGAEIINLLDVISTNVTKFFREEDHFSFLKEAVLKRLRLGQKRFRIWSCACSTGEEAYSIAMIMAETCRFDDCDWKILATDISTKVLEKAQNGVFHEDQIGKIPSSFKQDYFIKPTANDKFYQVKPLLRQKIAFARLNLSQPPFPMKGPLDAIFCRNVMIYFDNQVRKQLLEEIKRLMSPTGFLFVGSSESLTGLLSSFGNVRPSIYKIS